MPKKLSSLETISPLELKNRRGKILKAVSEEGRRFLVQRRNKKLAKIVPLNESDILEGLTPERIRKMQLLGSLTDEEFENLEKLILLCRGKTKIKLTDLFSALSPDN